MPEWLQEFRENLVDDGVPEHRDFHASSSHEPSLEPTPTRSADLGKHSVYTQFPKDRNCDICQRTKITRAPCRRRSGGAVPHAIFFGDLITADHKVLSEGCESRNNHRCAFVVQDLATQWIQSYPCKTKTSQETQRSLQKFLEPNRKPKVIHTDNSLEFGRACEDLSWNHCTSTPHRSGTYGVAERAVRRVKEGTSAVLLQSGLNENWWADSMECYTYLRNIQDLLSDGKTPYERRCGEPFKAPIIPFGSLVEYFPISSKDQSRIHQFGKKILRGLFLGYALYVGEIWKGDILVADFEELETMNASEIYSKRLNAKEVIFPKKMEKLSSRRWTNQTSRRRSGTENTHLDTGFTQFTLLEEKLPYGYMWSGGGLTRRQLKSRPDHLWPELWIKMGRNAKLKEKHNWSDEEPKLDNARRSRGIYFIDPEDKEFKDTIKNSRKKLETPMALAMPCKTSKTCKHGETRGKTNEIKSKVARILEASESTRLRMEDYLPNSQEVHIAGKEDNSLQHYNLVHKFITMPQAIKIPAAKAAVDKEWEKLEKIPAWDLTKVRSKSEVTDKARTKGAKVHFASLMDICHLKNAELDAKHQKYKGRIVLRSDIVKDDSGSCAVFTEQGASASQMTAAK